MPAPAMRSFSNCRSAAEVFWIGERLTKVNKGTTRRWRPGGDSHRRPRLARRASARSVRLARREVSFASLRDCRFDLDREGSDPVNPGVVIPGLEGRLPDGVFVRGVPGGTLEQVVLRLDFLHALKLLGVPVYNDGRAIERTVDKAMTSFVLARAGIPTPATWVTESEARRVALPPERSPAVANWSSSHCSVRRARDSSACRDVAACLPRRNTTACTTCSAIIEPAAEGWHDWRVFVIDAIGGGGDEPPRQGAGSRTYRRAGPLRACRSCRAREIRSLARDAVARWRWITRAWT